MPTTKFSDHFFQTTNSSFRAIPSHCFLIPIIFIFSTRRVASALQQGQNALRVRRRTIHSYPASWRHPGSVWTRIDFRGHAPKAVKRLGLTSCHLGWIGPWETCHTVHPILFPYVVCIRAKCLVIFEPDPCGTGLQWREEYGFCTDKQ